MYGLVFSLRNMTKKLSPRDTSQADAENEETLHSFSTATYTLSHLQTPTKYTFVLVTDPVPPPTRRPPHPGSQAGVGATFSGGGGIPATGGMTTTGVLAQIVRGPWVDFVARNAGCTALEREDGDSDSEQDTSSLFPNPLAKADNERRRMQRQQAVHDQLQKRRLTGLGNSVDSEAFRAAVERGECVDKQTAVSHNGTVLSQNKLSAPRM